MKQKTKRIFPNEKLKDLNELENNLSRRKKYCDYDDIEYKRIRDVGNVFNQSIDEDYYKPIKTASVSDNKSNYIEYESKGDKTNVFQLKNIFT